MFGINFTHLIKNQLPYGKRTPFNVALHEWWLHFVKSLHEYARAEGDRHYEYATTTTQIGSLVQILNAHFDSTDNSIYITDVDWIDDIWVFLEQEPYEDVTIYLDSETIDPSAEVYLYLDAEMNPYQFIVWIPASLNTPAMLEQITALVNQHCLAGKSFIIQIIP